MTNDTKNEGNLTCLLAMAKIEASELENENDKLRKLVCDMWIYITEPDLIERFVRFNDISARLHDIGLRFY